MAVAQAATKSRGRTISGMMEPWRRRNTGHFECLSRFLGPTCDFAKRQSVLSNSGNVVKAYKVIVQVDRSLGFSKRVFGVSTLARWSVDNARKLIRLLGAGSGTVSCLDPRKSLSLTGSAGSLSDLGRWWWWCCGLFSHDFEMCREANGSDIESRQELKVSKLNLAKSRRDLVPARSYSEGSRGKNSGKEQVRQWNV
jgi:hypothetical protein